METTLSDSGLIEVSCNGSLPVIMRSKDRIIVQEGGTSSGKTYGFAQAFISHSFNPDEAGAIFSIYRRWLPALKVSALRDFRKALEETDLVDCFIENKTERTFTNVDTGTIIEFQSLDKPQKARGPRRRRLWMNEANEMTLEDYKQLAKRTSGQIYIDYNPSMLNHWIYKDILNRPDVLYLHSTYKDNRFLDDATINEIEIDVPVWELEDGEKVIDWDLTHIEKCRIDGTPPGILIAGDSYRWAVYGLGRRGAPAEAIYPYVFKSDKWPDTPAVYGLDFGFNHPTVLVKLAIRDVAPKAELHIDEVLHQSYLTIDDIISMLPGLGVTRHDTIYADGSRPEAIEEMNRAGYWVRGAEKGPGSVKAGIDFCKRHRLCFTARSELGKLQCQDYRWKKRLDDTVDDDPVKLNDDAPDAIRYGAFTQWGSFRQGPDVIIVGD